MLDKIILGLLLFRSLSIYDIKKAIDRSVGFFFSSSYGNIQPSLKKLELGSLVSIQENVVNGRNRKEYTINDLGRNEFIKWLSEEIHIGKIQDEGLLKLFFLTELPKEKRLQLLENYIEKLKHKILELEQVDEENKKAEVPEKYQEAFNYRVVTLDFGIQYYNFELRWYENIIYKIKRNKL
jgi:DNA-binding PadR family transcriptional regulator